MSYQREKELTFSIEEDLLNSVLSAIWPISGVIEVDGTGYVLHKQRIKTCIHLFSSQTDHHFKDRIKLTMGSKGVIGSRDTKKMVGDLKYERVKEKKMSPQATIISLNEFGMLLSAFFKEKATLTYLCRGDIFKVGIDKVVAFNPQDPLIQGESFYHIEFEGENVDTPDGICHSDLFKTKLAPLLKPLEYEDTKWLKASEYCSEGTRKTFNTPNDLSNYFKKVVSSISPLKVPLEDLI